MRVFVLSLFFLNCGGEMVWPEEDQKAFFDWCTSNGGTVELCECATQKVSHYQDPEPCNQQKKP